MSLFEFARDKEKQAEEIYRKLSEMATNEGFIEIFKRLADAEKHHHEIILKMEAEEEIEMLKSGILSFAQETINQMRSGDEQFKAASSQIEVYKAAQAHAAETENFYRKHAVTVPDEFQRKVLLALAKEEHQHFTILKNIIDFISFPATHPEEAEFHIRKD